MKNKCHSSLPAWLIRDSDFLPKLVNFPAVIFAMFSPLFLVFSFVPPPSLSLPFFSLFLCGQQPVNFNFK